MHRWIRVGIGFGLIVSGLAVAVLAQDVLVPGAVGAVRAQAPATPQSTPTVTPMPPAWSAMGPDGCNLPWTGVAGCPGAVKAISRQPGECDLVTIAVEIASCVPGVPPSGQLVVGSVSGWQSFNVADLIGPDGIARWTRECGANPESILLMAVDGTSLRVTKKCCPCTGQTCCCGLPPGTCDWDRNVCDCEPPTPPIAP